MMNQYENTEKIPCRDCLMIPVCRYKYFIDMKDECCMIEHYLFRGMIYDRRREDFSDRIDSVYKLMRPSYWGVKYIEAPLDGASKETPVQEFSYRRRAKKHGPIQKITRHFKYQVTT